jgi:phospho-N-acetylmuramoyl-pentapeptide-transferase
MSLFTFNVIKILLLSAAAFIVSFSFTPLLIRILNKFNFWKKTAREKTITGESAAVFNSMHKERETSVPRGGGLIIWIPVLLIIFFFFAISFFPHPWWFKNLNFLSRKETWLPLLTLVVASIVGLFDDALTVYGKGKYVGGGMTFKRRLLMVALIGLIGGLWLYFKLDWNTIHVPLLFNFPQGIDLTVGIFIIPIFIIVMIASWSGGVIDGIDGLSGGVFASIFAAFMIIAFAQGKMELAAFCAVILGTLCSFLWFNIPPAKFYMGETGILGLTSTMTVVAFLTDSLAVLPIIAGLLVIEVGSIILQLFSKKFRHKKIWLSTPIHHHFEAKGWRPEQVTMRFWIIGVLLCAIGIAIRLMG